MRLRAAWAETEGNGSKPERHEAVGPVRLLVLHTRVTPKCSDPVSPQTFPGFVGEATQNGFIPKYSW